MSLKDNISKFYPLIIITIGVFISGLMIFLKPIAKPDEVKFPDPFVEVKKISLNFLLMEEIHFK